MNSIIWGVFSKGGFSPLFMFNPPFDKKKYYGSME